MAKTYSLHKRFWNKVLDSDCEQDFGGLDEFLNEIDETITGSHAELPEVSLTERFGGAINDVLKTHIQSRIPKNTVHQTQWAVRIWSSWATARNSSGYYASNDRFKKVLDEIENPKFSHEERAYWLSKVEVELRKENGELYMPNSLMRNVCGLQRHLRKNGYADLNFSKFEDFWGVDMY